MYASYRVMHGLSGQHHDALCRRQLLHPCILRLAGCTQCLIGLLLRKAHVLPSRASLTANDFDSHWLIWMIPLQGPKKAQVTNRTLSVQLAGSQLPQGGAHDAATNKL